MARFVGDLLMCTHPAIGNRALLAGTKWEGAVFSHDYEFSTEMARFIYQSVGKGRYQDEEWERRCFKVAKRASCYHPALIDDFGLLSESGAAMLKDVMLFYVYLDRHYLQTEGNTGRNRPMRTMDEIVGYGSLSKPAVRLLRHLWDLAPDPELLRNTGRAGIGVKSVPTFKFETTEYEGKTYLLSSSIRNYSPILAGSNLLLKFGLIYHQDLSGLELKKGRPPVGMAITENGKLFCQDYVNTFDPETKAANEFIAYMRDETTTPTPKVQKLEKDEPAEKIKQAFETGTKRVTQDPNLLPPPVLSEIPDVLDGENLRDLFG